MFNGYLVQWTVPSTTCQAPQLVSKVKDRVDQRLLRLVGRLPCFCHVFEWKFQASDIPKSNLIISSYIYIYIIWLYSVCRTWFLWDMFGTWWDQIRVPRAQRPVVKNRHHPVDAWDLGVLLFCDKIWGGNHGLLQVNSQPFFFLNWSLR